MRDFRRCSNLESLVRGLADCRLGNGLWRVNEHNDAQTTEDMLKILYYLVFTL